MIQAYKGERDQLFWKYIFKYYEGGSGSNAHVDGWVVTFIPYLENQESALAKRSLRECMNQMSYNDFNHCHSSGLDANTMKTYSSGVNITPFIWNYHGQTCNMKLISGFAGATMNEDGYIMP